MRRKRVAGYALSVFAAAAATILLVAVRDHVNQITVTLALTIADPQNRIALAALLVTALTVGGLSVAAFGERNA